jgi:3-methyladenine DNA glycosylase AlkD
MTKEIILTSVKEDLEKLTSRSTPKIRAIGNSYLKSVDLLSLDDVILLSRDLLDLGSFASKTIAFQFLLKKKKGYKPDTFDHFERIAFDYLNDWWDTDDFTTHALGELIHLYPYLSYLLNHWTTHERFAVRRAAATALILSIKRRNKEIMSPFEISNRLMHDPHYLVTKGYGWMLKVYMAYEKEKVIAYLKNHENEMPRLAFRYAIEKLSPLDKQKYFK